MFKSDYENVVEMRKEAKIRRKEEQLAKRNIRRMERERSRQILDQKGKQANYKPRFSFYWKKKQPSDNSIHAIIP